MSHSARIIVAGHRGMARSAIERGLVAVGFGVAATDLEVRAILATVAPKSYQTLAAETGVRIWRL